MTINDVQRAAAAHFGVPVHALRSSGSRLAGPVFMRHVAMFVARIAVVPEMSYPQIGRAFGYADHTSAVHGFQRVAKLLEVQDSAAVEAVEEIRRRAQECDFRPRNAAGPTVTVPLVLFDELRAEIRSLREAQSAADGTLAIELLGLRRSIDTLNRLLSAKPAAAPTISARADESEPPGVRTRAADSATPKAPTRAADPMPPESNARADELTPSANDPRADAQATPALATRVGQ